MNKKNAVIFDMDGTLCDVRSIRHLVTGKGRNFHAFHMESASCPPNMPVVEEARKARARGDAVLIVTARMYRYKAVTSMWLALHSVPSDALYMRADGDCRQDYTVKREILNRIRSHYTPIHAFDDNPNVIALWAEEGVPCTTVPGWGDV
ncbi:hypothetical protein ABT282_07055 [Streptomyces sp. NPDC000927]|uniref:phosphatase domain-containing protein n=1 Tax=Streptomyces sp. NPDC000927 TaxID=3154371 RepID=UPI00332364D9